MVFWYLENPAKEKLFGNENFERSGVKLGGGLQWVVALFLNRYNTFNFSIFNHKYGVYDRGVFIGIVMPGIFM